MYEDSWKEKSWTVETCEGDCGLLPKDVLTFGSDGTGITVQRSDPNIQTPMQFLWGGQCTYVSEVLAHVTYNGQLHQISRAQDVLTCGPYLSNFLILSGSGSQDGAEGSGAGGLLNQLAGIAGGITVGAIAGYLLGAPLLGALAGGAASVLIIALIKYLVDDPEPDTDVPPSSWTAQGGGSSGPGGNVLQPA